jgi:CRP/FNR family transcriptional regulator
MITRDDLTIAIPALSELPSRTLEQIARAAVDQRYAPNAVLYRAGDAADALYVVLSGKVLVVRETNGDSAMLHTESAGGVLGEIPVFGGGPFPATATAIEPSRCAKLPVAFVERLVREEPEFSRFALRRLAVRAQSLLRRIDDLTASTVTSRLAAFVLHRASTGGEFTLGASQAALAIELGTAREVVVRSLGQLVEAGAIARVGRSRFIVKRLAVLKSIARAV